MGMANGYRKKKALQPAASAVLKQDASPAEKHGGGKEKKENKE
jgi:hypothetical protein